MEISSALNQLDTQTLKYILKNETVKKQELIQKDFLKFVKTVWPDFIEGKHHKIYAEKLNRIANGELKRSDRQHASKAHEVRIRVTSISGVLHGPSSKSQANSNHAYR